MATQEKPRRSVEAERSGGEHKKRPAAPKKTSRSQKKAG
jgi:hypothetical protein